MLFHVIDQVSIVVFWIMMPCQLWSSGVCSLVCGYQHSSEELVTTYNTTQNHNPEDYKWHFHHNTNIKSQLIK